MLFCTASQKVSIKDHQMCYKNIIVWVGFRVEVAGGKWLSAGCRYGSVKFYSGL